MPTFPTACNRLRRAHMTCGHDLSKMTPLCLVVNDRSQPPARFGTGYGTALGTGYEMAPGTGRVRKPNDYATSVHLHQRANE